jgi:putative mRNA 3-end processing factor
MRLSDSLASSAIGAAGMTSLVQLTDRGLYCPAGDFFVDPWKPVPRAIVTHGHGDHARPGSQLYLTANDGVPLVQERVGSDARVDGIDYGTELSFGNVHVSLHPAGHILGSAQVRIEQNGEVCVVSGDYKTAADPTCRRFEPIRCHTFITESTFALPIYRWRPASEIFDDVHAWWRRNQERGRTSVVFAYALGKAQHLLAGLDPSIGPILVHGAVDRFLAHYSQAGVALPPTERATTENARATRGRALVVAPPSAANTPWMKKFGEVSLAMASGWMQIRGPRRRRALDAGFALSDHADWNGLLDSISATGAQEVWATHGYSGVLVRWLTEHGIEARAIKTAFEGEEEAEAAEATEQAESTIDVQDPVDGVAVSPLSPPRERGRG